VKTGFNAQKFQNLANYPGVWLVQGQLTFYTGYFVDPNVEFLKYKYKSKNNIKSTSESPQLLLCWPMFFEPLHI
jgi:hypothetical protein